MAEYHVGCGAFAIYAGTLKTYKLLPTESYTGKPSRRDV